jgi:hypothetical protein
MAKRAAIDPQILLRIADTEPETMTNEELLDVFEHLANVSNKNPGSRGAKRFKQNFRKVLLERMEHEDMEHPPTSAR